MFVLFSFFCFFNLNAQRTFDFTEVASGLSNPVDITNDGFNIDRLYAVQQGGAIRLIEKINGISKIKQ